MVFINENEEIKRMVYEISYADEKFAETQKFHVKMAKKHGGFDTVIAYGKDMLDEEFKERNKDILALPRGGYWIWKPHIINMTLERMEENDYLFYVDAGAVILHPVKKLISVMEKNKDDIMVFAVYGRTEEEYTKRDVFTYFSYETEECLNSDQIMSGFILIKKNAKTVKIFREWETACEHSNLLLDGENTISEGKINYPRFKEHRHDQSILSVLLKKNGVEPYRDPSQWGLFEGVRYRQKRLRRPVDYKICKKSKYPEMMFFLHRNYTFNPPGSIEFCKYIVRVYLEYLQYWYDLDKQV